MASRDVVVIGASAGGVEALRTIVAGLPGKLEAAIFAVVHTAAESPGLLADLLQRHSELPVRTPDDRDSITRGVICVAPPDHHILLTHKVIRVFRGPRENRHRPAVDVLFRSAARAFGPRVVGVVLTGYLDDGTAGLVEIKRRGGMAIIEDPETAQSPGMPRSALRHVRPDFCLPVSEIAPAISELAGTAASQEPAYALDPLQRPPTGLTCPECGGALWQLQEGEMIQFRCRVGHRYSPESMLVDQDAAIERALWAAMRALEERTHLSERLARRAADRNSPRTERHFREIARESLGNARVIRGMLLERPEQEQAVEAQNPTSREAS
jgi:two-component system chemotaxis response regulator CheB